MTREFPSVILAADLHDAGFGPEIHRDVKVMGGKLNNLIASVSRGV